MAKAKGRAMKSTGTRSARVKRVVQAIRHAQAAALAGRAPYQQMGYSTSAQKVRVLPGTEATAAAKPMLLARPM